MQKIVISGNSPSKKNSKRRIWRKGNVFMVPSESHENWHEEASWELKGKPHIPSGTALSLHFYFADNRKKDLTNSAESIMDLLVDNGLLDDDSWQIIPSLELKFMGLDKNKPRCEVVW